MNCTISRTLRHQAAAGTGILSAMFGLTLVFGTGCSNATEGAVSGAGIGALSGLAIGSLSGNAGAGAAAGAIVGGVGGAVIGDQNKRRDEATAAATAAQQQPKPAQQPTQQVVYVSQGSGKYSTGQALGRLVGKWQVKGTIDSGDGKTVSVSGTANGTIERTYFVRLDIRFTDPRNGQAVEGTSMISQTGGRGIEMTNSFSTSPEAKQFKGTVDETGTIFTLSQTDPPAASRRITMRPSTGRDWTAEVWNGDTRAESYTFSPM